LEGKTLSKRIFELDLVIILAVTLTILFNVWTATINHAREQLERDLKVAEKVFEQVLSNRESMLFNSASVLTDDFGFKQAVATSDTETIKSALVNQGDRIEADIMGLLSLDGVSITSSGDQLVPGTTFQNRKLIEDVLANGGASSLSLMDGKLYQIILLTVNAPTPIAIALVGFEIDDGFAQQIRSLIHLDTTIQVATGDDVSIVTSTLPNPDRSLALHEAGQDMYWYSAAMLKNVNYISKQFALLENTEIRVIVTLSESSEILFSNFNDLLTKITLIVIAAISVAMLFSTCLSRKLMKPLAGLAEIAGRISSGYYRDEIAPRSGTLEIDRLASAIKKMQTSIGEREERITFQADHDALTELKNRRRIGELLCKKLNSGTGFQALGINIYGFRGINDLFGYHNGDKCLQVLSDRVGRLGGFAGRLNGGELLWIPDLPLSHDEIWKVKAIFERPVDTGEVTIEMKVAIGVLYCPENAVRAEDLFKRMNIVLDEAQITRQLVLDYADEMEGKYLRRLKIITELKRTFGGESDGFNLLYQPKLDLASGEIKSVEALIRWNSAELGFVSPEEFIRIAESAGFISEITRWVIKRAISDQRRFVSKGLNVCIAINLSVNDLLDEGLLQYVISLLKENRLPNSALSFEITESDLVNDAEKAVEQLQRFQAEGFCFAIDDFGTGYSSLEYLQKSAGTCLENRQEFRPEARSG